MGSRDGSPDEMHADRELELALAGHGPPSEITEIADALRALRDQRPEEDVARGHVVAAARAAQGAGTRRVPFWSRPPRSVERRRPTPAGALAIAAVGLALVVSLASAGILPDRVQATVADLARHVGLNLPDPSSEGAGDPPPRAPEEPGAEPASRGGGGGTAELPPGSFGNPPPSTLPPITTVPPGAGPAGAPGDQAPEPPAPGGTPRPTTTQPGPPSTAPDGPPEGIPGGGPPG